MRSVANVSSSRVTVVEYEDGGVSIRFRGVALAARPFYKDGCVTRASIVENNLLRGSLTEIRKRKQQHPSAARFALSSSDLMIFSPQFQSWPASRPHYILACMMISESFEASHRVARNLVGGAGL